MDTETYFLTILQKTGITESLQDDCAWLSAILAQTKNTILQPKALPYIIAMDSFVENIHFQCSPRQTHRHSHSICSHKDSFLQTNFTNNTTTFSSYQNLQQWISYKNLAKKAFLVNISDMLSSGALPKYALLSLSLPKNLQKIHINAITQGLEEICKEFKIKLIGGDTICGNELGFHIAMIGKLHNKYLSRNSVRKGDLLAYTSKRNGNLGSSLKSLKEFIRYGARINSFPVNILESNRHSRFIAPILRIKFLLNAQKYLHACMDISDGLGNEIKRLESLNNLHFSSFLHLSKDIYQSGEEYELLFSFSKKNLAALQQIAKTTRTKIHIIGQFGHFPKKHFHTIKWHQ